MKPAWPTSDMTDGTLWAKGFAAGAAAALVLAVLLGGGTQFEAFVRVAGGGQYLLDARADEPAVGRIVNMPIGALGEAALVKRSWIVATTYAFTLRLRPEVAPGSGEAVSGLQVTVRLPGRTVSTNATRVAAGSSMGGAAGGGAASADVRGALGARHRAGVGAGDRDWCREEDGIIHGLAEELAPAGGNQRNYGLPSLHGLPGLPSLQQKTTAAGNPPRQVDREDWVDRVDWGDLLHCDDFISTLSSPHPP